MPDALHAMLELIGDTPASAAAHHAVTTGRGEVLLAGRSLVVVPAWAPAEAYAFGHAAAVADALVSRAELPASIIASADLAATLADALSARTDRRWVASAQPVLTLVEDAFRQVSKDVRQLLPSDFSLLAAADRSIGGGCPPEAHRLLKEALAVGAILGEPSARPGHQLGGKLVCVATADRATPGHVLVTFTTLAAHRNQGLATAALALVCRLARRHGRTPVFIDPTPDADADPAAARVAEKVGFTPVASRARIVPRDA